MCSDCFDAGRCVDAPTEDSADLLTCVACENKFPAVESCEVCHRRGHIELTGCRLKDVTPDVWEMMRLIDWMEQGLAPTAGGVFDQAQLFMDAFWFVKGEQAHIRAAEQAQRRKWRDS